ncbi:MAG: carboxypeptidase regulatory-like domain-containing protein [Bacteroidetes bacterium]|nr:carboxypeptidase regulatory-like domain-containing protein [Bacteroidota bacterium]
MGNGILIERVSGDSLIAVPGKVGTVAVQVQNITSGDFNVITEILLPEGWQLVSGNLPYSLPAGESILQIFSFHIAPGAPADEHFIQYSARDTSDTAVFGSATIGVTVTEIQKIVLTTVEAPTFVLAGEKIRATFLVQNLGNKAGDIFIKAENCDLEGDGKFFLAPNESKVFRVTAPTLSILHSDTRKILRIEALQADDTKRQEAYVSHYVRVIPRHQQENNETSNLPAALRVSHVLRKWQDGKTVSGFQGEFYTKGSLDEAGKNRLEARLRGSDRFDLSALGLYDEYFASLETPGFRIFLGDKTYGLTPLTEFSRYGRGGELSTRMGKYEVGGFYQKPRFLPGAAGEMAGYLRFFPSGGNQIGLNFLHKESSFEKPEANLASLHGVFQFFGHTDLEGELSKGISGGSGGSGFSLRASSQALKKTQVSANVVYAGKNYPGYFTNTWNYYASANYQATARLNLSLHLNQDAANASRDTLFGTAPYSKFAQFGAGYKLSPKTSVNTFLRRQELKDLMPGQKFHYRENLLRLLLNQTVQKFRLSLTAELGRRENLLDVPGERTASTFRTFLNATYQPSARHYFFGNAQFHQYRRFSDRRSRQWIFGCGANSAITPSTDLRLAFQSDFVQEEYYKNRNLLELKLNQFFGKNRQHELSLACNYVLLQRTASDRDFSLQTSYTYHFGIRTARRGAKQGIYGRISNRGVESVEGIVLYLDGQKATTDAAGNFAFPTMPPGTYFLMLDPSSAPLHVIPDIQTPIQLTLEPGVDARLDFGLTMGATISGAIEIEPERVNTRTNPGKERPKVFMLELSNGKETFRQLANENQRFQFSDFRPGVWKLRVVNESQYKGWQFERSEFDLEILPGAKENIHFHLLQKKRDIKFQEELSLTGLGG